MIKATRRHSRFSVDPLPHQWDVNQELRICGLDLDAAPEVHFANAVTDPAPVVQSTLDNGVVCAAVPNFLLQQAYTITAYIYVTEKGTERTQHKISIPVLPRPKPADYVYTETEVKRYEALEGRVAKLEGRDQVGIVEEPPDPVLVRPAPSAPSGPKLMYSIGVLSDPHISDMYTTDEADLQVAAAFLNDAGVDFTCIAGDLTWSGERDQLEHYKELVDSIFSAPVFDITGNHEIYERKSYAYHDEVLGHPLCYSFEHQGDVFIMLGTLDHLDNKALSPETLQFAYETLEANRNKRCFVFLHIFPTDFGGVAAAKYIEDSGMDAWGSYGDVFENLLRHYKNAVFFHGHSHLKLACQEEGTSENYSTAQGYRSIHIPSLTVLREYKNGELRTFENAASEGYVVDVYPGAIHLRGRDFYNNEFLPFASYWINTAPRTVEPGTFVDPTGVIKT